jgi:hypothetical protein
VSCGDNKISKKNNKCEQKKTQAGVDNVKSRKQTSKHFETTVKDSVMTTNSSNDSVMKTGRAWSSKENKAKKKIKL